jgi:hypothetical protein
VTDITELSSFSEHLGSKFKVTIGEKIPNVSEFQPFEAELELTETVERNRENTEGFSLLFQGDDKSFLSQKLYTFSHEKIGDFQLFIVPVGKNDRGYQYEAIINRLISQG